MEDATQEAMLRAWRSWQRYGAPRSPTAWMTMIARREAARWSAGPHGRSWASCADRVPEAGAPAADLAEALDVRGAVQRLPEAERALVALRYQADLTQAEIARLTGIPEGTVKVRLHRARARLRAELT